MHLYYQLHLQMYIVKLDETLQTEDNKYIDKEKDSEYSWDRI